MKKHILTILTVILISTLAISCNDLPGTETGDDSGTETPTSKPWDDVAADDIVLIPSSTISTENTEIESAGEIDWLRFQGSEGYFIIMWEEFPELTCDVQVSVFKSDGTLISGPKDYGYTESAGFELTEDTHYSLGEYIYIKVEGKNADSTGTYSLIFS